MVDLLRRDLTPEILDLPGTPAESHREALVGLARVNAVSRTSGHAWRAIKRLAIERGLKTVSVLDIGCGGGDVPLDLQRRALHAGLKMNVTGYDFSPTVVDYARAQAVRAEREHRGAATDRTCRAEFEVRNIFARPPEHRFDVVMCSLFLHHLDNTHAKILLRTMADSARRMVLVNDLVRSRLGYVAAQVGVRFLSRNSIVHQDGPHSVARAFRVDELRRLADDAGLTGAQVRTIWPFRFLMTWEPTMTQLSDRRRRMFDIAPDEVETFAPIVAPAGAALQFPMPVAHASGCVSS